MSGELDVLIVGSNRTTGGIQRYIDQQEEHLSDLAATRVYDTELRPGSGTLWLVVAVAQMIFDALVFPLRRRPDVVHVHTAHWFSFYRASFYVLFAAHVWQVPVVLHVHGSSFDEFLDADSRFAQAIQRVVFGSCDSVITLSEYWREAVESAHNVDNVTVVQNAVASDKYTCSADVSEPTIVYISHLTERKGAEDFATAISRLLEDRDDVTVHVAGAGPFADRIERLEDEFESLSYHGYVSEQRKRELLAKGSIFVLPSYAEGLPIAILEAMAAGNAIVSTSVGSIPEVISDDNGWIIPPGEPAELRTSLDTLCDSPETIADMAESNCASVSDHYNWDQVSQTLLEVYGNHV